MKRPNRRKRALRGTDQRRAEYRFNYAKARSNRFAGHMKNGAVTVILDPDVAAVFSSSKAVNAFLRSVIATLPVQARKRAKAG